MRPISTVRTSARSPGASAGDGAVDWPSAPRRSQSAERPGEGPQGVQASLGGPQSLRRHDPTTQGGVGLLGPGGGQDRPPLGIGTGLDSGVAVAVGPAHLAVAVGNGPAGRHQGLMTRAVQADDGARGDDQEGSENNDGGAHGAGGTTLR